jgi:hypothetical protein
MMTYQFLKTRPALFSRLVGLTVSEFDELYLTFQAYWQGFVYQEFIEGKPRKRKYGGGNSPRVKTTEDKLLYILAYVRLYPIQVLLGFWFNIDESVANRWIHRLLPLLEKSLAHKLVLPKRKRGRTLEEIINEHPDLKGFLIDGMEQPIRRPKDNQKQKDNYSGKKKRHVKKNIVVTDNHQGYVYYLGTTQIGTKHDKKCADEENLKVEQEIDIGMDTGFLGLNLGKARIIQPMKKPKGIDLTDDQKAQNKVISQVRIVVEHGISGIKRSRIAADIYRNVKKGFDDLSMEVACGLHNYRVNHRYAV